MPFILVVDDYADTRELLSMVLEGSGYDVLTAENGAEALQIARERRPDVIVMDIFMPVMDGVEATERLKADPRTAQTPVIAYTARQTQMDGKRELFAAVCQKPCSPDVLLSHLKRSLETA